MRAQRLVVGLDGSDGSDRAVTWLAEVARGESLHVDAVHVLTYSHEFVWDLTPATMTTWRKELEQDLRTRWARPLQEAGFSVAAHVVEADGVAAGLAREAARPRADLVVVGRARRAAGERPRVRQHERLARPPLLVPGRRRAAHVAGPERAPRHRSRREPLSSEDALHGAAAPPRQCNRRVGGAVSTCGRAGPIDDDIAFGIAAARPGPHSRTRPERPGARWRHRL
jgi:nucleotide-binding universal stress UspA family protein